MRYIKYNPAYKTQLVQFLEYMWEELDENERRERFEWRYENNPYSEEPFIYLALGDDKVVGVRAFVVQEFIYKGNVIKTLSPADVIIHPDYRRKGLFTKLNKLLLEDLYSQVGKNIILNLSSNKYSTIGYLKQGWIDTETLKTYCYRFSLSNHLKRILLKNKLPGYKPYKNKINNMTIELTNILRAKDIAQLIKNNRDQNKLINVRDERYFQWRYSYKPEQYSYMYCMRESGLLAYIIFKHASNKQAIVEEYFTTDYQLLRMMFNFAEKKLYAPVIRCFVLTDQEKKNMRLCGFIKEPIFLLRLLKKQRLPVLVRATEAEPEDSDYFLEDLDIRDVDNWAIQQADKH